MPAEHHLQQLIPNVADAGLYVEIGVLRGTNLVALAEAFPSMRLIGVDSYEAYEDVLHGNAVTSIASAMNREIAEKRLAKYRDRIELWVTRSQDARHRLPDLSCDMVFLDKGFTVEEQYQDVLDWLPKVKIGGILAGHEANTPQILHTTIKALGGQQVQTLGNEVWFFTKK